MFKKLVTLVNSRRLQTTTHEQRQGCQPKRCGPPYCTVKDRLHDDWGISSQGSDF